MFGIQPMELMVILLLALLVFGPKKLPEFGRTVGKSLREFRRATNEVRQELRAEIRDDGGASAQRRGASSKPEGSEESKTQSAAETASPGPEGDGQTSP
jgi:sec-independent protein translocase protein TatA